MRLNRKFALGGVLLLLGGCPVRLPEPIFPRPPDWLEAQPVVDPEESATKELQTLDVTKQARYEAEQNQKVQIERELTQLERPGL